MANTKISALTSATTPLAGTEVLPIVQSGATVKVAVSDLTAGRSISVSGLTNTGLTASKPVFTDASKVLTSTGVVPTANGGTNLSSFTANQLFYASSTSAFAQSSNMTYDGTTFAVTAVQKLQGTTTTLGNSSGIGNNSAILRFNGWNTGGANWQIDTANLSSTNELAFTPSTAAGGLTFTTLSQSFRSNGTIGVGTSGSTSGSDITFLATQSASSDANTLDDYEEGSWTPTLGGTSTYITQAGRYTKIGNIVYIQGQINVLLIGTGSASTMSGLPFTAASGTSEGGFNVTYFVGLAVNVIQPVLGVDGSSNSCTVYSRTTAGTGASAVNVFGDAARLFFYGHYQVA